jgi:hypothetical protein
MGRRRQTSPAPCDSGRQGRGCVGSQSRILPRGFGPKSACARTISGARLDRLVQPRLAWGARNAVTRATGSVTGSGDPPKRRTAKSSTMKGPQGLASESNQRRCRTAKDHRRWVSGCFSFRPAEITKQHGDLPGCPWRLRSGGSLRRATMTRGVTPASDVTDWTKANANPGSTVAAGVVPGAWLRACAGGQPGD